MGKNKTLDLLQKNPEFFKIIGSQVFRNTSKKGLEVSRSLRRSLWILKKETRTF